MVFYNFEFLIVFDSIYTHIQLILYILMLFIWLVSCSLTKFIYWFSQFSLLIPYKFLCAQLFHMWIITSPFYICMPFSLFLLDIFPWLGLSVQSLIEGVRVDILDLFLILGWSVLFFSIKYYIFSIYQIFLDALYLVKEFSF